MSKSTGFFTTIGHCALCDVKFTEEIQGRLTWMGQNKFKDYCPDCYSLVMKGRSSRRKRTIELKRNS